MFGSIESFAESTEAFPLGTRMTLGKRKIRRKSRDAWCSTLKSLCAYGTMFFIGAVPSDLRQTAYRQSAFYFIHWLEQPNQHAELNENVKSICAMIDSLSADELFKPHMRKWADDATKAAVWEVYRFIHVNTVAPFGTFRTKIRKWKKAAL